MIKNYKIPSDIYRTDINILYIYYISIILKVNKLNSFIKIEISE